MAATTVWAMPFTTGPGLALSAIPGPSSTTRPCGSSVTAMAAPCAASPTASSPCSLPCSVTKPSTTQPGLMPPTPSPHDSKPPSTNGGESEVTEGGGARRGSERAARGQASGRGRTRPSRSPVRPKGADPAQARATVHQENWCACGIALVRASPEDAPQSDERRVIREHIDSPTPGGPTLPSDGTDSRGCEAGGRGARILPQVPDLVSDVPHDLPQAEPLRAGVPVERLPHAQGNRGANQAEASLARRGGLRANVAGDGLAERPPWQC